MTGMSVQGSVTCGQHSCCAFPCNTVIHPDVSSLHDTALHMNGCPDVDQILHHVATSICLRDCILLAYSCEQVCMHNIF